MLRIAVPATRDYTSRALAKAVMAFMLFLMVSYLTVVFVQYAKARGEVSGSLFIGLEEYSLTLPPIPVAGIKNLSGLTFNPDTETLFGVLNSPPAIVEFTRHGELLRQIKLESFEDTEAISYLGDGRFAVAEERRRMVSLLQVDKSTEIIRYSDGTRFLIDPEEAGNKGLEGMTYDPQSRMLLVVKEHKPRRTYFVPLPTSEIEMPRVFSGWNSDAMGLRDLTGMQFHPETETLLIASDESKEVVETTLSGEVVSRLRLRSGYGGLSNDIEQAEGVTVDDQGTIYIVSEPNILYVYKKRD
jgi:uncharacterized protein YjiK